MSGTTPEFRLSEWLRHIAAPLKLSRDEWRLVGLVFIIKVALLIFGLIIQDVYMDGHANPPLHVFEIWSQWDGPNYTHIAQHGYLSTGDKRFNIAFFPGYPLFIAAGIRLGLPAIVSAYLVTAIASLIVPVLFYRLARLDENAATARRAVWFLYIFPTAYFLHSILTESLFLAFALGAFLAARYRRWPLAGVLGVVAALTRMNGILLLPAFLAEIFVEWRETRRIKASWLFALLPICGLLAYLQLNKVVTGNPFMFMEYQRTHWNHRPDFPWHGMYNMFLYSFGDSSEPAQMTGTQEFIFALMGLVFAIPVAIQMRPSYGVWVVGNWLMITSMSFLTSTPRYLLLFFPMFILWGRITRRRLYFDAFTVCCLIFFAVFAGMYAQTDWGF